MAAEKIKKKQINTAKQELIIAAKTDNPNLGVTAIAEMCDTSHSYVTEVLQRYNISKVNLDDFKTYRADILTGLQARLLSSITAEEIQKAIFGSGQGEGPACEAC